MNIKRAKMNVHRKIRVVPIQIWGCSYNLPDIVFMSSLGFVNWYYPNSRIYMEINQ